MRIYGLMLIGIAAILASGCKNDIPAPQPPGPEWRVYTRSNSPIAANRVRCLTLVADGSLWIGTDSGASRFTPSTGSWTNFKDSLKTPGGNNAIVTSITQSKDLSIWFGTIGAGVIRFNPLSQTGKTWTKFTGSEVPLVASGITAYKTDPTGYGEVWVTSNSGLDRFDQTGPDEGTWTHFDPSSTISLPTNNIVSAFLNPINDHLWFGAAIGGAVEAYYDINLIWGKYESPVEQYKINTVAFDLDDNVWFGKEVGASRLNFNSGNWTYFTTDSTNGRFPGGSVNAIVTNYHSIRWFGMDSGLVLLDDTTYTRFTQDNSGLSNNRVSSLALDLRGNIWIGTQFGLAVYKKGGTQF